MAKFRPKKNKYLLDGKNGRDALKMLHDVTTVLEKYNVKYWLDFGTLLGIVRENRILPWDDDMDISIFEEDIEIVRTKVMPELKAMRYRDYLRYFNDTFGPLQKGTPRAFKVRTNRFFFFKGHVKLDIFIMYKSDKKYNWVELGELHSFPEDLLEEFDYFDFNGKKYRIPKDYDKYLTYHYGDWRTPNPDYNSSVDNGRTLAK